MVGQARPAVLIDQDFPDHLATYDVAGQVVTAPSPRRRSSLPTEPAAYGVSIMLGNVHNGESGTLASGSVTSHDGIDSVTLELGDESILSTDGAPRGINEGGPIFHGSKVFGSQHVVGPRGRRRVQRDYVAGTHDVLDVCGSDAELRACALLRWWEDTLMSSCKGASMSMTQREIRDTQ